MRGAPPRRIAVLESKAAAHSGYYLTDLARHWQPPEPGTELVFVLPPTFAPRHPRALAALESDDARGRGIRVCALAPDAWPAAHRPIPSLAWLLRLPAIGPRLRFRLLYLARWLALRREVVRLGADVVLIMSLDDLLLPALVAPPPARVGTTGILFKPSFHYRAFEHDDRRPFDRLTARFGLLLLRRFARRPEARVLTLDPLAAQALEADFGDRVAALPEPARADPPDAERVEALARSLSIDRRRTCFLLLGALDARRGVHQVLAAIGELDEASAASACLLLAGTLPATDRPRILAALDRLRSSPCRSILAEGPLAEHELGPYFQLADVVLVTHHRHVGSSGTLLHAAAAGRPVLATRAGLIGHLVRTERLGITVDSSSPAAIARGMRAALSTPRDELFDARSAARFAARNTPLAYAGALLAALAGVAVAERPR